MPRTKQQPDTGPYAKDTSAHTYRRRIEDEIETLFRQFIEGERGKDALDLCFMRDWLRNVIIGDGLRTSFRLILDNDQEHAYLIVPREHVGPMDDFLTDLKAGKRLFQPVGKGWALWTRPEPVAANSRATLSSDEAEA